MTTRTPIARRKLEVFVSEEIVSGPEPYMMHYTRIMRRWTVTTNTGYRCVINECPCGLRHQIGLSYVPVPMDAPDWRMREREIADIYSVELVNCTCRSEQCRRSAKRAKTRCHGWHRARVDAFVKALEATAKPMKPRDIGSPRFLGIDSVSVTRWAELVPEGWDTGTRIELDAPMELR